MKNKGVTLIALIVTIVVLLILAGITIGTLTGENGLIGNSKEAKEQTEIANEKEALEQAVVKAMGEGSYGNIEIDNLEEEIKNIVGEGKTQISDLGDGFEIEFIESNRYYEVDTDGNVGDYQEIIKDQYPGDITKGMQGNELNGTSEQPYEIWCIEDLCELSNRVNNGYSFGNCYIKLMRDLDFKSRFSYVNGIIGTEGKILSCNSIEELLKGLSQEGTGFISIGNGNSSRFAGNFNGNNKQIKNIYVNSETQAGLFGVLCSEGSGIIKDLTIAGNIISNSSNAGAICATVMPGAGRGTSKIINCKNLANVGSENNSNGAVGGIVGAKNSGENYLIIDNCSNFGKIQGGNSTGGIIGNAYTNTTILNCYNTKEISGRNDVGGIAGNCLFTPKIYNCYNIADVTATGRAGGIIGFLYWSESEIKNCYNIGKLTGTSVGGIVGAANISNELLKMEDSYFLKGLAQKGIGNWNLEERAQIYTKEQLQSEDFVNELNAYIENNEELDTTNWRKWQYNKNQYPTFK